MVNVSSILTMSTNIITMITKITKHSLFNEIDDDNDLYDFINKLINKRMRITL